MSLFSVGIIECDTVPSQGLGDYWFRRITIDRLMLSIIQNWLRISRFSVEIIDCDMWISMRNASPRVRVVDLCG